MGGFAEEGKAVGVVLDISLRHEAGGRRIIDVAKEQLGVLVRRSVVDDADQFYLYRVGCVESVSGHGEACSLVGNYEPGEQDIRLGYAMKQALYVVESLWRHERKYLMLFTDRMWDVRPVEKAAAINEKDSIGCRILVVGIGDRYDRAGVNSLGGVGVRVAHIDDPALLAVAVNEAVIHGY